jgi:two-component system, sensor histidine kinase and response regulator
MGNWSLRRQLITTLVLSMLTVLLLTCACVYLYDKQASQALSKEEHTRVFRLLRAAVAVPLAANDPNALRIFLNNWLTQDNSLTSLKVLDTQGRAIVDWHKTDTVGTEPISFLSDNVLDPQKFLGRLETAWSPRSTPLHLSSSAFKLLIALVGTFILLILSAIFLALKLAMSPLTKVHGQIAATLPGTTSSALAGNLIATDFRQTYFDHPKLGQSFAEHGEAAQKLAKAEQKIQELLVHSELILNSAGSGVFILDENGMIAFVNSVASGILGWQKEECIGRYLHELIQQPPNNEPISSLDFDDDLKDLFNTSFQSNVEIYDTLSDQKKHESEQQLFWDKNGLPVPVRYVITPIIDNVSLSGVIVIFENISLRLKTERLLKDNEALKQAMLESSLAAIITIDHDDNICEFNKNAEILFGYKKSDVLFKQMGELIIPPRYREAHRIGMEKYLQSGEHNFLNKRIEITALKKSGEEFPVELVIAPIKLKNKYLFTSFIIDITEKNNAKAAIENARLAAENANKAKSQFLAAMSHEIRTPLNAVIGVNELLQTTDLNLEQAEYVKISHQASISLQEVVNNILDYSKIEAGKVEFHLQKTDILEVVDSVLSIMGPKASEKKLDLFATIDYPLPEKILLDPACLRQILLNLVSNAIKFTPTGSVEIRVELKDNSSGRSFLLFSVVDTGIGISEEAKKLIFEEFTQADLSTTRKYGGTGLGLAIASRLVSLFGGEIGIDRNEGEGSSFWFTITSVNRRMLMSSNYQAIRCYIMNSPHKSIYALYKHVKVFCNTVTFIASVNEISNDTDLAIVFVDERQFLFYSEAELDAITALDQLNIVKVLITDISPAPSHKGLLRHYDTYLTRPLKTNQLSTFLKNCLETYNRGQKLTQPNISIGKATKYVGSGFDILLVEDSINNQKVIKATLDKLNYTVDIASNGHEALEKTTINKYDLILMDISMPVMGGMETTEHLRKNEGLNQITPIIALTASAYEDKKKECQLAGMNGILTKPLNMADLQNEMERLLKTKGQPPSPPVEKAVLPDSLLPESNSVIDYATLTRLKTETSEHIFPELLSSFLEQGALRADNIQQAVRDNDFALLKAEIHAFKSESATFGASKLAELTAQIDLFCKDEEREQALLTAKDIHTAWRMVSAELNQSGLLNPSGNH